MKLEYHPRTVADFNEAADYYEQIHPRLSEAFRAEILGAIERVLADPFLYAEVHGIRRALLKRYPYSIIYKIVGSETVRILVIRHHKRHPTFGSEKR